jgi:LPXTG-motif cell wall-anchored protein
MRPWQSSFGIASEITSVSTPAPVLAATGSEHAATAWIGGGALIVGTAIAFLSALRRRRSARMFDCAPE